MKYQPRLFDNTHFTPQPSKQPLKPEDLLPLPISTNPATTNTLPHQQPTPNPSGMAPAKNPIKAIAGAKGGVASGEKRRQPDYVAPARSSGRGSDYSPTRQSSKQAPKRKRSALNKLLEVEAFDEPGIEHHRLDFTLKVKEAPYVPTTLAYNLSATSRHYLPMMLKMADQSIVEVAVSSVTNKDVKDFWVLFQEKITGIQAVISSEADAIGILEDHLELLRNLGLTHALFPTILNNIHHLRYKADDARISNITKTGYSEYLRTIYTNSKLLLDNASKRKREALAAEPIKHLETVPKLFGSSSRPYLIVAEHDQIINNLVLHHHGVAEVIRRQLVSVGVGLSNACDSLQVDWFKIRALYNFMLQFLLEPKQPASKGRKKKEKQVVK